jgi:S1-C subfamily serine protease
MAMGSPFALSRSVTLGIVSNTERVFTTGMGGDELEEREFDAGRTGMFTSWIQHDALINPGNSGGPLVNSLGQVIGVNTATIAQAQGLCFAVAVGTARNVASQLLRFGRVKRGWIGIHGQTAPLLKGQGRHFHLEQVSGVLVAGFEIGSPADKAGLKTGDQIVAFDQKPIQNIEDLLRVLDGASVGKEAQLSVLRLDQKLEMRVKPGESPD